MASKTCASDHADGTGLRYAVVADTLLLTGDLTSSQVEALLPSITPEVKRVDLSGVNRFDSAGLAWLVTYFSDTQMQFVNYPTRLSQLADLYGLTPLFPASGRSHEKRGC